MGGGGVIFDCLEPHRRLRSNQLLITGRFSSGILPDMFFVNDERFTFGDSLNILLVFLGDS